MNFINRFIKKCKLKWYKYQVSTMYKDEKDAHKKNEVVCTLAGHNWGSNFNPKNVNNKTFKERVFCKRCGVMYHEHTYVKICTEIPEKSPHNA